VGVPAARGHGVMEVQSFEAASSALVATRRPEHDPIFRSRSYTVDSPWGSLSASTEVPPRIRAVFAHQGDGRY